MIAMMIAVDDEKFAGDPIGDSTICHSPGWDRNQAYFESIISKGWNISENLKQRLPSQNWVDAHKFKSLRNIVDLLNKKLGIIPLIWTEVVIVSFVWSSNQ